MRSKGSTLGRTVRAQLWTVWGSAALSEPPASQGQPVPKINQHGPERYLFVKFYLTVMETHLGWHPEYPRAAKEAGKTPVKQEKLTEGH